jgi:hypothetical protein
VEFTLSDCTVEMPGGATQPGAHRRLSTSERAIWAVGARVILTRTTVRGIAMGAIGMEASSHLTLLHCTIRDNHAETGGGILVAGDSELVAVDTAFVNNSAAVNGGGLQVDSGRVHLLNGTLFDQNSVADGAGSSIYLSSLGELRYTLPAPPGRWLIIRQGSTYESTSGAEELDFPFACREWLRFEPPPRLGPKDAWVSVT